MYMVSLPNRRRRRSRSSVARLMATQRSATVFPIFANTMVSIAAATVVAVLSTAEVHGLRQWVSSSDADAKLKAAVTGNAKSVEFGPFVTKKHSRGDKRPAAKQCDPPCLHLR